MTKVIHLKLIDGEEILGKLCEDSGLGETSLNWVLEKVRSLTVQPMGEGQAGLAMIPFMMGDVDGQIRIPRNQVIGAPTRDPPKQVEDAYLQQVSGLAFATQASRNKGKIQL